MPRPKRVYDPMTGVVDRRRSKAGAFPVRDPGSHAHVEHEDATVAIWGDRWVARGASGHRDRFNDTIKGVRIA
jgi:hypothetical protein